MKHFLLNLFVVSLMLTQTHAASLVVDDFSQGDAFLSTGGSHGEAILLDTPFGDRRTVSITQRAVAAGSTLTAALKTDPGQLEFVANGTTTTPNVRLFVDLYYVGHDSPEREPASIIGYTGLVFSFRTVSGEGTIKVSTLPASPGMVYPEHQIPLTEPGEIFYPIEKLRISESQSPDTIWSLYFLFTATDGQLSFILDEIRFVPEPGSLVLLASGAALALRRRARPGMV